MDWPARSPDLNPIEHVWDALGRRIGARHPSPRTLVELRTALLEEWGLLPLDLLQSLYIEGRHWVCQYVEEKDTGCDRRWGMGGSSSKSQPQGGFTLDCIISKAELDHENPLYRLVNYHKGGALVEAHGRGGSPEVERVARDMLPQYMYQGGKGSMLMPDDFQQFFPREEQVVVAMDHLPDPSRTSRKVCWRLDTRGFLGESIMHVLVLCNSAVHTKIALVLLRLYPALALDVIEGPEYYGASGLHLSIAYHNEDLILMLVECRADVNQRAMGRFFLPTDQQGPAVAKYTNYDGLFYMGEYPLAWAAGCEDETTYNLLISQGADPNMPDMFGNMILHVVVIRDKLTMYGYALHHPTRPAKEGILNRQGLSPLSLACKLGRNQIFREMMDLGALAYGKHALSIKSCEYWFRRFKSGDFDTRDKERGGRPIKFEDAELEALLDEDSSQTQEELAETLGMTQQAISNRLKVMGMVQKQGNWVPYELKPGNIERRNCTCELLLKRQNRKGFLHRIVTGDEKWIHYDNPKRRKSSVKPGHASTSTAKPNIHGKKLMLCIWWDQLGVIYYELLQPNETITGERYQQQLMRLSALKIKRPLYAKRHDKVIYQHDNARPHVAKVVKETLEALQWDVLPHPLYSPDIAPSDYHMFRSMTHGLAEQHFTSYEEAKNWVNVWIASKDEDFFRNGIRMLPERWEKVVAKDGQYFE
ncbi:Iav [Cordylochernes scorpioides]|uniref:Iav n=1 Tax=Cordylochernes scorpioides TaxID=51811 RepID=A0ABY6L465_9ARAC|nr:Iav [Cordylochernes scorpioides]